MGKYATTNRQRIWSELSNRYWCVLNRANVSTSQQQLNHPGRLFVFEDFVRLVYVYIDVVDRIELHKLHKLYHDLNSMQIGQLTTIQYELCRQILNGTGKSSIKYWLKKCDKKIR